MKRVNEAPRRPRLPRSLVLAGLIAALALGAYALHCALLHRVPLAFVLGLRFHLIVLLLVGFGALTALAVRREARELRAGDDRSRASLLRWAVTIGVLTWLAFLFVAQPFQRLHFELALGLGACAWGALVLGVRQLERDRPRLARGLDLVAFSLAIATLGLELGLRGYAAVRPTPLLARVSAGPGEVVERFRCAPGEIRFGFPCNPAGFYDEEFTPRPPGDDRRHIAIVGDSFSVGAVPHAFHYTTVLEELLDARVDSFGIAGIGPAEYAHLVATEVLPLAPDEVVIALFVGNDLDVDDPLRDQPDAGLRRWFQRDQVLLLVAADRLGRERAAARRRGGVLEVQDEASDARVAERDAAARAFPWVLDPLREEPTLDEATFLDLELRRAVTLCASDPPSLDVVSRSLLAARAAAGDRPVRVLLIPDEFQIDEELWGAIEERAQTPLERDRPQRLLNAWLAENGFEVLDLLPHLRAEPPLANGRPHLYHRADTHFNARGNDAAARALAEFLR